MKYEQPRTEAIFFGLFLQAREGGLSPLAPPGSATGFVDSIRCCCLDC